MTRQLRSIRIHYQVLHLSIIIIHHPDPCVVTEASAIAPPEKINRVAEPQRPTARRITAERRVILGMLLLSDSRRRSRRSASSTPASPSSSWSPPCGWSTWRAWPCCGRPAWRWATRTTSGQNPRPPGMKRQCCVVVASGCVFSSGPVGGFFLPG